MNFKKIFIILVTLLLFSGCKLFTNLFTGGQYEEKTKTIEIDTSKGTKNKVYLVKLNVSDQKIQASKTGIITATRDADEEIADSGFFDTDQLIRNQNHELNQIMSETVRSAARAGESESSYIKNSAQTTEQTFSVGAAGPDFKAFTKIVNGVEVSETISTKCVYAGKHCYIFADTSVSESDLHKRGIILSTDNYKALGEKFDACYELEIEKLGNPYYEKYNSRYYAPCNKKIRILITDLFGDAYYKNAQDNQLYTGGTLGYFYSGDIFSQSYLNKMYTNILNQKKYFSNECEMFYIDSFFLTWREETVYSTLVHEFNHMINYVIKTLNYMTDNPNATGFNSCSTWYTEMLSMVTEDMFQDYLKVDDQDSPKARLPYFNNYYIYGFKNWNEWKTTDAELLYMYANTYAFGAFLARNFGGVKLVSAIAKNPYVDELSITSGLKECGYTDVDFNEALRRFSNCLFDVKDISSDNYYSFNKESKDSTDAKLYFKAIDINNITLKDSTGGIYKYPARIFSASDREDIWPYGFSVHYVGENLTSFDVALNTDSCSIEYYLLTSYYQ